MEFSFWTPFRFFRQSCSSLTLVGFETCLALFPDEHSNQPFSGSEKKGLLEKGSFQKSPFSRDSRHFRDSRASRRIRPLCRDSRECREFRDSRDSSSEKTPFVVIPFPGPDIRISEKRLASVSRTHGTGGGGGMPRTRHFRGPPPHPGSYKTFPHVDVCPQPKSYWKNIDAPLKSLPPRTNSMHTG